jgi:predicted ATP-dependent protease
MVFWRAKSVKPTAAEPLAAEEDAAAVEKMAEAESANEAAAPAPGDTGSSEAEAPVAAASTPSTSAKIISMLPARLSDRLAEAGGTSLTEDVAPAGSTASAVADTSRDVAATKLKENSTSRQRSALRAVINDASAGSHVLVLGPAGTGRRSAAVGLAKEIAKTRPQPPDWVYVATGRHADVLHAHAVPAGMGERVVRDIHDALEKSSAMLTRLIASDNHQMTLAVLEEEHRHRSDGGLDQLKRRAEAQNIALVKTSEGFVLAPMHEGRVVRADVFRALPESLQRDVETKVTAFEAELQSLLVALPGNEVAIDDRHLAVAHEVAERAVKPNLAVARKLFPNDAAVADVFDAIEADWTRRAVEVARRAGNTNTPLVLPGLHAICAASDDGGAPVVLARSAGARDLIGEIGYGIDGAVAVRPGHLARANGGFLIIDAWRLAADPQGWAALSAALETGLLQPASAPGLAVTAEALPLHIKLILIAENDSLAKLKDIDPRTEQYFGAVVRLEGAPTPLEAEQ